MHLSKEQINSIVAPSPAVQKQFVDWLSDHGLVLNNDYTIEGDVIMIKANIDTVEKLFATTLFAFKKDERGQYIRYKKFVTSTNIRCYSYSSSPRCLFYS